MAEQGQSYWRSVPSMYPTEDDFKSPQALGQREPKKMRAPGAWTGVSVFISREAARNNALEYPSLAKRCPFIAELKPHANTSITIEGPDDEGHCDMFGDAGSLLASVAQVVPL